MKKDVITIVKNAKLASFEMARISSELKNDVLNQIALNIEKYKDKIIEANKLDLIEAQKNKISEALLGRLKLDENKLRDMVQGVKDVAKLDEPVNKILMETQLDEGLLLKKIN